MSRAPGASAACHKRDDPFSEADLESLRICSGGGISSGEAGGSSDGQVRPVRQRRPVDSMLASGLETCQWADHHECWNEQLVGLCRPGTTVQAQCRQDASATALCRAGVQGAAWRGAPDRHPRVPPPAVGAGAGAAAAPREAAVPLQGQVRSTMLEVAASASELYTGKAALPSHLLPSRVGMQIRRRVPLPLCQCIVVLTMMSLLQLRHIVRLLGSAPAPSDAGGLLIASPLRARQRLSSALAGPHAEEFLWYRRRRAQWLARFCWMLGAVLPALGDVLPALGSTCTFAFCACVNSSSIALKCRSLSGGCACRLGGRCGVMTRRGQLACRGSEVPGRRELGRGRDITLSVARGLQWLHAQGILHQDLRPRQWCADRQRRHVGRHGRLTTHMRHSNQSHGGGQPSESSEHRSCSRFCCITSPPCMGQVARLCRAQAQAHQVQRHRVPVQCCWGRGRRCGWRTRGWRASCTTTTWPPSPASAPSPGRWGPPGAPGSKLGMPCLSAPRVCAAHSIHRQPGRQPARAAGL